MITHVVIFWTDKNDSAARARLLEGCKGLESIPGVLNFRYGTPVSSPRGVVDDSYTAAISMDFVSQADADAYQSHPDHVLFVEKVYKPNVKRVVIYDYATPAA